MVYIIFEFCNSLGIFSSNFGPTELNIDFNKTYEDNILQNVYTCIDKNLFDITEYSDIFTALHSLAISIIAVGIYLTDYFGK